MGSSYTDLMADWPPPAANWCWISGESHHFTKPTASLICASVVQVVSTKGCPPICDVRLILPSAPRSARRHAEHQLVGDLGRLGIERGFAEADPVDVHGHLAFTEQLVRHEDVHGAGLDHRRHVLEHAQEMLHALDGLLGVHDAFGMSGRSLGFIPDAAAMLPDERVDRARREVVALAGLIGDAVEIVVEHLAGELVALLALEELADMLERRSSPCRRFLRRCRAASRCTSP